MSPKLSILLGVLAVILVVAEARRERTSTTTTTSTSAIRGPSKLDDQKAKVAAKVTGLKERVGEAVEKVKVKSREQRMDSEKKRVERKLRRDQKKVEKELSKVEPQNPHNLKMPDCSTQGMVYNGRRCVLPHKMRV